MSLRNHRAFQAGEDVNSALLYLFEQFFVGKATEHLIGEGGRPEHLNDDRLGRVLDKLHKAGLEQVFLELALAAARKFRVSTARVHLDSSSFHVPGEYAIACLEQTETVVETELVAQDEQAGRPRKEAQASRVSYHLRACLVPNQVAILAEVACAGRFILATNITDPKQLSSDEVLQEYKAQQSADRGFRFLKEPLFFTSSVFVNSPERVAALAMVMGLCLLVYNLGQRALRQALVAAGESLRN